ASTRTLYVNEGTGCARAWRTWPDRFNDSSKTPIVSRKEIRFGQVWRQLSIDWISCSYANRMLGKVDCPTQPGSRHPSILCLVKKHPAEFFFVTSDRI